MGRRAFEAVVYGIVQGVSFRYHTRRTAVSLDLVGWVCNRSDGTVALHAEGEPPALRALEAWLAEGPAMARVDCVQLEWREATGRFSSFDITY